MTPLKTTLRGAIGILAGLGRDELTIDLTKVLPEGAVTVAIKGDNGAGKSTLMNLGLSPWLNPPQLPGSMYEHFGPEGERILEWSHGDERYRSTIQYRQTAKTPSTRAFLHVWRDDDWHPVTLPDHTVSDGKARTYSACLEQILGSQSVYYLSAFRAQNAPSLSDYDDPKGLMRDLLHLDEPSDLADQAGKVRLQLQRAHEEIKGQAEALVAKQERLDEVAFAIPHIETGIEQSREDKQKATEGHARAKAEYDRAISEDLDLERVRGERRKVEKQMDTRRQQRTASLSQIDQEEQRLTAHRLQIEASAERDISTTESDILAVQQRIVDCNTIISQCNEIHDAVADCRTLEQHTAEMEVKSAELRQRAEAKRAASINLTNITHTLDVVRREGLELRSRMEDQNRRAAYVDLVKCGGKAPYDDCIALLDAVQAAKDVPATEEARGQKLKVYRVKDTERAEKQRELEAMGDPGTELHTHEEKQRALQEQIKEIQKVAALMPSLERAETDIEQAGQQLAALKERLNTIHKTEAFRLLEWADEEAALKRRRAIKLWSADAVLFALQLDLDALPLADASDAIDCAKKALSQAEAELNQCTQSIEDHAATLAQHRAERTSLTQEVMAGAGIAERANFLHEETRIWRLLSDGMRGVVDLSIEDAGPGIAEIANRLLLEGYGPRFTVRIITQRQNKTNDTVKEIFDISVIDSETGLETSIVHKSGGESVWLDKALTDAVALYHQEAAGMQFGSLFADEAEDGLTAERKQQFYKMDRKALEIGGFAHKFFVSHNPDAWAMADAVIDLGEYRSEVAQ